MDFIVLLIIFGVISALGKSNKKQIQNKRPGSSFPQNQRPQNPSPSSRPRQTTSFSPKNRESLQDSLTTIFNALAGEEILKSPEEKKRDEERARRIIEAKRSMDMPDSAVSNTVPDITASTAELISEMDQEGIDELQIITLDDEAAADFSEEFELDLSDAKKGIIWSEILEKPLSLRK